MQCAKCGQEMQKKESFITNNGKPGKDYKEYSRVRYWCEPDDIWMSIETPIVPPQHLA